MFWLRISVALSLLSVITAQFNPSVCKPFNPGPHDPPRPNMTYPTYSVRVEANIVNKNFTADYHEHYDSVNNLAAFKKTVGGTRTQVIYSFGTNELFTIDKDSKQCTVSDLANSSALTLFGYQVAGKDQAQLFSAGNALRFSKNISAQWINVTSVRGVPCNLWRSCAYWPAKNATMVLDWYFSVVGRWSTQGLYQVPIRAHIKGATINTPSGLNHTFEHYYDFMDFSTTVNPDAFQTPESVYCPKRKLTKPLPTATKAFHFSAEILDLNNNLIGRIKEWYDFNLNLVRFDSTPMIYSPYGQTPKTHIHDFTTGVAYTIDNYRGNCSVTNISNAGFDVRSVDATHVRIRSGKEYFYFDKTNYNYEGQKMARGILCDVWITQRTDWPPYTPGTSTWEWYFATSNYTADLPDIPKFGLPIMLEMRAFVPPNNTPLHYIYNFYAYDEKPPVLWDYDIGPCYNYTSRKDYNFILPGNFRKTVNANMDTFKNAVLTAIRNAGGGVSSLRINNIQIDYADNNDIIVYFTLLERPPPIGNVVNPKQEAPLTTVASQIQAAINGGTFQVKFNVPNGQPTTMTAKKNTLTVAMRNVQFTHYKQTKAGQVKNTGYSGGVMAGMGVALAVVFCILGVVGMYLFKRKSIGAVPSVRFENQKEKEDITQDFS